MPPASGRTYVALRYDVVPSAPLGTVYASSRRAATAAAAAIWTDVPRAWLRVLPTSVVGADLLGRALALDARQGP